MLKIGFVGTGGWSTKHAEILSGFESVTIKAFCGTQLHKADRLASRWNGAKAYEDIDQMVEKEKLDAVYICVPPFSHGKIEQALIDRGIPFFVEKPLGINREVPHELLEQIEQKGLLTSVGYHWRYMDSVIKAKELLAERHTGVVNGFWMGSMPRVKWWGKQSTSGGQFVEQTTHITDLLRNVCGEASVVYAVYNHTYMNEAVEGSDVADGGAVVIKMETGVVAQISNTCLLPFSYKEGLDIYTEAGVLEIRGDVLRDIRQGQTVEYRSQSDPYVAENKVFIHALLTGDVSGIRSSYADAVHTHDISIAANTSAETGLPVKVRVP